MADKPKKRRRVLDQRRRKLLEGVKKGMNIRQAGVAAGYSFPSAAHRAFSSMRSEMIQSAIRQGMGVDKLVAKVIEKTEAKETQIIQYQGSVTDKVDLEAHGVQLDACDKLIRIFGGYPERNDEGVVPTTTAPIFNINLGLLDSRTAAGIAQHARERIGLGGVGQSDLDVEVDKK